MLLVVRHADAGDKRTWTGPDSLRPLSPSGLLQAEGLVVRLEDYPVERILCSPTLRCYQTVEPLARDRLLRIESVPELGVKATPAQLLELFWDLELRQGGAESPTRDEVVGRRTGFDQAERERPSTQGGRDGGPDRDRVPGRDDRIVGDG
jgi:broad specificity phosphatase PhoE